MNRKKIQLILSVIFFVVGSILIWNIWIKFFFHDFLYETPNLKGLTQNEAQAMVNSDFRLINMASNYSEFKKGEIYSQLPVPSQIIKKTRPIKIWISKGRDAVILPNLKGKSLPDAQAILNELGLKINSISRVTEGSINNIVIGTDPQSGSTISRDHPVSLLIKVSVIKKIKMPDILGFLLLKGEYLLSKNKLVTGDIKKVYNLNVPDNTIISTGYSAGTYIFTGSVIDITVSTTTKEE